MLAAECAFAATQHWHTHLLPAARCLCGEVLHCSRQPCHWRQQHTASHQHQRGYVDQASVHKSSLEAVSVNHQQPRLWLQKQQLLQQHTSSQHQHQQNQHHQHQHEQHQHQQQQVQDQQLKTQNQQQQQQLAHRYGLRQANNQPGPAQRLRRGGQLTPRHYLQQYLASIDSSNYVTELAQGIWAGDRLSISRSLTLCESSRPDHALQAAALLRKLIDNSAYSRQQLQLQQQLRSAAGSSSGSILPEEATASAAALPQPVNGAPIPEPASTPSSAPAATATAALAAQSAHPSSQTSLRIGVSGPPGAGKSSLIETWGCYLADHGSKVAVLAVDPSSAETGGAILGDKTRMVRLSSHPNAFVRPSPARGTLGGVSRATYDAMVICEAAGFDKVLVETVGVGQSEVAVADLVDCMLLVMPPVGGDDLQMIKRGIMEVADVVLVNKADGHTEGAALRAASEYSGCVNLMPHRYCCWNPQVLAVSAHTGKGVPALARLVAEFQAALTATGELLKCRMRRAEAIAWLSLEEQLLDELRHDKHVRFLMAQIMPWVRAGSMAPRSAADIALSYFYQHCS